MFYCGALGAIENGVPQLKRFYTLPNKMSLTIQKATCRIFSLLQSCLILPLVYLAATHLSRKFGMPH